MAVTFQSLNLINNASKVTFSAKKPKGNVNFSAYEKQPEAPKKVKAGVFATTVLGVVTATALCMKAKKFDIKSKAGILNGLKNLEYEGYVVPAIAAGSIGGGLLGGALFDDKKNMKAKCREAAIQMFANVLIPLFCVEKLGGLFKKFVKTPLINKMNIPKMGATKARVIDGLFDVASLAFSLLSAMFVGNKATNLINEKVYNIRDDRTLKIADLSGHVDDSCLALSRAFEKTSPIGVVSSKVSRIIPAALVVCGYSSGVVQEWPDEVREARKVDPSRKFGL